MNRAFGSVVDFLPRVNKAFGLIPSPTKMVNESGKGTRYKV